jgi:hypothetical protein
VSAVRWLAIGSSRWWLLPAAAFLALLIIGGYGFGWRWTGLSDAVTLWDWMQVLALPVALAGVPLLLRHRRQLSRHHHAGLLLILVGFGALVLAGYLVPLSWTGFSDNTLWDWLELLLLPLVVATASLWAEPGATDGPVADPRPRRRYLALAMLGGLIFGLLVLFGYLVPWSWTGFSDNTAWDWVKLLLLPILVPLVLLPIVTEALTDRLTLEQSDEPSRQDPLEAPEPGASTAASSPSSGSSPDVIDDQGP